MFTATKRRLILWLAATACLGSACDSTQGGWRCFENPLNPEIEHAAFADCIIERTRLDMKRNPQLYEKLASSSDLVAIEFIGADKSPDDEDGWIKYRFRYSTAEGSACFYHFPDAYGGYHIPGPDSCNRR